MVNSQMKELGKKASAIRELYEYGKKRKSEIGEDKVFDFSLGNPSVMPPKVVNETIISLLNDCENVHAYTSAVGDYNVRKSIAKHLNDKYFANVSCDYIYLTCGAAASLTITLNALLNKGEEVIIFSPYFPEYKVFIEKANGIVQTVLCDESNFYPNLNDFESKINNNTKAVIINSPNNPTGVIYNEACIKGICDILKKKEMEYNHPIYLISDEPYRELVYSDAVVPFITNYYNNSIICYSFSKSLSIPGERIGYILVSSSCINKDDVYSAVCGAGRSLGYVCAPSLFQYIIPKCLSYTSDLDKYKENRDILYKALKEIGFEIIKPEGAFYIFMKVLGNDALSFSEKAKEFELLLVPSESFGFSSYVRIAYCVSKEQIINSLDAFKKLFDCYK